MKKKLEAELTSIAHRILQMKHKDDVRELHHETQKLYEKLSVLLFVEENFGDIKPTIGLQEIEAKLEKAFDFDEKIVVAEIKEEANELVVESKIEATPTEKPVKEESVKTEVTEEPKIEAAPIEVVAKEEPKQEPIEEVVAEEPKVEIKTPIIEIPKPDRKQVSIDDILGEMQPEPIFDRVSSSKEAAAAEIFKIIDTKIEEKATPEVKAEVQAEVKPEVKLETAFIDIDEKKEISFEKADPKPATNLNDKLNKKINIGLNDRIAFEKNLFGGSSEDFNRVVSQLSTFDTLEDAKNFIEEMVKPDYNDWKGQDEFASRFMEFVENKFV
ncbi:hypothetical protein [Flavobacterium sp.]|uniref:hypothetical protein n=1 Tax=Flavobacterium sp. TaxID=239 RepID=UPI0026047A9C|nr:hypothetical protein [Flavobacterium sp.]